MIKVSLSAIILAGVFLTNSCTRKVERPVDCVQEFIVAVRQHDMSKSWSLLGPEAVAYYNSIGEKNRKSGKGIFEHDIKEIKRFKADNGTYKIIPDLNDKSLVRVETETGQVLDVNIIEYDGEYKIKDSNSVQNLIKAIAAEVKEEEYY